MLEYADLAQVSLVQNTIPNAFVDIEVTDTPAQIDLNALESGAVSLLGKRIRFYAVDGSVSLLRGTHAAMTTDEGLILGEGEYSDRFFVPPEPTTITVVAGGSVTLRCFYDD